MPRITFSATLESLRKHSHSFTEQSGSLASACAIIPLKATLLSQVVDPETASIADAGLSSGDTLIVRQTEPMALPAALPQTGLTSHPVYDEDLTASVADMVRQQLLRGTVTSASLYLYPCQSLPPSDKHSLSMVVVDQLSMWKGPTLAQVNCYPSSACDLWNGRAQYIACHDDSSISFLASLHLRPGRFSAVTVYACS